MSDGPRRSYPRTVGCGGEDIEFRYMEAGDEARVLAFARALPSRDLLFLRRDIAQPKVVAAWLKGIELGTIVSLLALRDGRIVGCAALVCDDFSSWSLHVGDLRVVVAPDMRGRGLGRLLAQETFRFGLSMGLEKFTVQMPMEQRGAIAAFQGLGFHVEALLRNHVRDRDGTKHDILVLSHDVAGFGARMELYGLTEAF